MYDKPSINTLQLKARDFCFNQGSALLIPQCGGNCSGSEAQGFGFSCDTLFEPDGLRFTFFLPESSCSQSALVPCTFTVNDGGNLTILNPDDCVITGCADGPFSDCGQGDVWFVRCDIESCLGFDESTSVSISCDGGGSACDFIPTVGG